MFPRSKVKYLNIITIVRRAEIKCITSAMLRKRSDDGFQYHILIIHQIW